MFYVRQGISEDLEHSLEMLLYFVIMHLDVNPIDVNVVEAFHAGSPSDRPEYFYSEESELLHEKVRMGRTTAPSCIHPAFGRL
jgi:hypothetical protein